MGVSILLVEDNPGDVLLVREALAQQAVHCPLVVAQDGAEAITLVERIESSPLPRPALIILDLNLPKKNGFEVLKKIRCGPKCGQQPVVILTSSDSAKDRDEATRLGATGYLVKPSTLSGLRELGKDLRTLLSSGSALETT